MGAANGGPGSLQLGVVGKGTSQIQVEMLVLGWARAAFEKIPLPANPEVGPQGELPLYKRTFCFPDFDRVAYAHVVVSFLCQGLSMATAALPCL